MSLSKEVKTLVDLKVARAIKKLTQEELAEKVGTGRQNISNIECGLSKPSVGLAKKMGEVLEVDWTNFFED